LIGDSSASAVHERSRDEQLGIGVRIVLGRRCLLGRGDVAGLLHEPPELGDRDRVTIDPETVDGRLANRRLLRVEAI